jgi:ceramide glucosyltransferase
MALQASVLAEIGGLPHLADFLADDFELGRAVRATGRTIACPPIVIDHVFPEKTAGEVWAHELRWGRTVRLVQPAGYIGSVVTYVTPLALIGAVLAGFSGWSLITLAALALARQVQAVACSRMMGAPGDPLWLVPARDLFAFAVFLAAIVGDRVEWRGRRLQVGADGAIAAT